MVGSVFTGNICRPLVSLSKDLLFITEANTEETGRVAELHFSVSLLLCITFYTRSQIERGLLGRRRRGLPLNKNYSWRARREAKQLQWAGNWTKPTHPSSDTGHVVRPVQHAKLQHRHPLASLCSWPISCRGLRSQLGARMSAGGVEALERKGLCQSRALWGKAALKFIQSWSTHLNTDQCTGPVLRHRSGNIFIHTCVFPIYI